MADIIRLDIYREQATPSPTNFDPQVQVKDELDTGSRASEGQFVRPDRLYPLGDSKTLDLQQALKLISEAKSHLSEALRSTDENDRVGSELEMQHLKPLMAELFCHRNIGEGFATTISCIFYSIYNNGALEFTRDQIIAINLAIKKISEDPFIKYDKALDLTDGLEEVGFAVEPSEFEGLADILDGESLR